MPTMTRGRFSIALASCLLLGSLLLIIQLPRQARAAALYAGVNLAGAEFGEHNLPGTYGSDYLYPTSGEVDYFMGKGMNTFRLPFRWERLQRSKNAAFDATEQSRLNSFVTYATGRGAYVVLDPHNYARYAGDVIDTAADRTAFADFWTRLANLYKTNSRVIFGLMNEPNTMATETWRDAAQAAINAIRATGATNLILVPGNGWTGAHSWTQNWYGTPNGTVMTTITDPGNNYAYDVHQYMDADFSGTTDVCTSTTIGAEKLAGMTTWLRQNGRRAFLGEFGGGRNSTCYTALDTMLAHIDANTDVWLGWTYWAAGPLWGEYIFTIEPTSSGADRPQLPWLLKHVPGSPQPTATRTNTPLGPTATRTRTNTPGGPTATRTATRTNTPLGPTPTRTRTNTPGGSSSLKLQYRAADTSATNNEIKPHFNIVNTGSSSVPLSELKIRYWYTVDGDKAQQSWCDWATVQCANVTRALVKLASARSGADYYLELGFSAGAGSVAAGGQSGEVQIRFNKTDWTNYNEVGDYSFDPSKTAFADWTRVTLYRNGTLVWGTEP